MNNLTYYQKNEEVILNRGKDYYENNKERLRDQEEKQKLKEYQKKYREAKMSKYNNQ